MVVYLLHWCAAVACTGSRKERTRPAGCSVVFYQCATYLVHTQRNIKWQENANLLLNTSNISLPLYALPVLSVRCLMRSTLTIQLMPSVALEQKDTPFFFVLGLISFRYTFWSVPHFFFMENEVLYFVLFSSGTCFAPGL